MKERAAVVIARDGRILLMHRIKRDKDYYVVPGGGVEPGETVEEAAIREAGEETGLSVTLAGKLCTFANDGRLEHYFLADRFRGEQGVGGPEHGRMSPENRYELEWVETRCLGNINLRPARIVPVCEELLGCRETPRVR